MNRLIDEIWTDSPVIVITGPSLKVTTFWVKLPWASSDFLQPCPHPERSADIIILFCGRQKDTGSINLLVSKICKLNQKGCFWWLGVLKSQSQYQWCNIRPLLVSVLIMVDGWFVCMLICALSSCVELWLRPCGCNSWRSEPLTSCVTRHLIFRVPGLLPFFV